MEEREKPLEAGEVADVVLDTGVAANQGQQFPAAQLVARSINFPKRRKNTSKSRQGSAEDCVVARGHLDE
jgi:hypothetical protein